jgi:N-acetylglucosaminyldiphosphoundecaprenol N-acetyl-beta-D-mannosaminyltransferase
MTHFPTVDVLGIRVAAIDMAQAKAIIHDAIVTRRPLHIGVVNAAKVVNMRRDPALEEAVLDSDIVFADGMSVVWASRLLGEPLPERVTGIDLMHAILEQGNEHRYRVYLLGATDDVVQEVERRIGRDYPDVVIAGRRNGYFGAEDEAGVAAEIAAAKPDVLLVAITSPKKEQFLARWGTTLGVPVYHGVGGSFDVYAGLVQRAPLLWQRLGLEWLYRLLQEPGRLWQRYLYTNSVFIWLVAKSWVARRGPTAATQRGSR